MVVLGVTGGVGSGKSRVLTYLHEAYQAEVCQLDDVAKMLQKKGTDCFCQIVHEFEKLGDFVVGEDGELDRARLASIVFEDPVKMDLLNRIVHPAVLEYVKKDLEEKRKEAVSCYVIESALLPEVISSMCDSIWYIYVKKEIRIERLMESRGYTKERIQKMMDAQPDEKTFRKASTDVIDNSFSFDDTKMQIGEKIQL